MDYVAGGELTNLLFDVLQTWRECDRNEPGMKAASSLAGLEKAIQKNGGGGFGGKHAVWEGWEMSYGLFRTLQPK